MSLHPPRPPPHQQRPGLVSTTTATSTRGSDRDIDLDHSDTQSFVEKISHQLEITKPTPIAPPNHECTWKERYLDLTAEIRQLKAELSTRASLTSYGQPGDDPNLLEVTIILHFRDRDDIVINTDVTREGT
ncbi:hypothetical protein F5Y08DRAFT_184117 [Xylaria arbuscula]|nr:hypothetical protein F5Y08DRAFT_184117 [Xylaria arbuscula]